MANTKTPKTMENTKTKINIRDFNLFYEIVKTLSKMSGGVKMTVNECGLTVYAKNDYSKCELTSNSIVCDSEISFCIGETSTFLKVLTTVKTIYADDFSGVSLFFDSPFLKIESKKFRTKISTVGEDRIVNFIGTKVHTELNPVAEFTTNSNIIKGINSHSFIFNDSTEPRIYVTTNPEMENNMVFATIGNDSNDLANSMTLELGMLNFGDISDKKIVLDFNRLNILNMIPSDEIVVKVDEKFPVMSSTVKKTGNDDTFFNINVYSFMMVK